MNLFMRPRQVTAATKGPPDVSTAIIKISKTCETLDKREAHMQTKVKQQLLEAKEKMKKGDKKGALASMKRKQMYQDEIDKILGARNTLEIQKIALESAAMNQKVFAAMDEGKNVLKGIHTEMDAEKVDETLEEIQEELDEQKDISSALSSGLDDSYYDEDTLLKELTLLEEDELEESLMKIPQAAKKNPTRVNSDDLRLPDAPTSAVQVDDVNADAAALQELEASLISA